MLSLNTSSNQRETLMTMYATLEEAIDAAREEFLADHP
ncbi:MysB family protein, partial [Salmonella enterica subsp. enterica serovar Typhimurium]